MLEELEEQASAGLALAEPDEQVPTGEVPAQIEQELEQEDAIDMGARFEPAAYLGEHPQVNAPLCQEICSLQSRIKKYYDFTLFDLLGNVPAGLGTQAACRRAGICIAQTAIFLQEVRRHGDLPVNTLSEILKVPVSTLTCNRMYILVLAESCAGNELSGLLLPEEQPAGAVDEALVVEVRGQQAAVLMEGGRLVRADAQGLAVGAWIAAPLVSEEHRRVGGGLLCALGAALTVLCFWFLLGR